MIKITPYLFIQLLVYVHFVFGQDVKQYKPVFEKINREVNTNAKAYKTLEELCKTIGHRLTGTPNGVKAEEFAYRRFKEYGFKDVEYFAFEATAWIRDKISLTVTIGGKKKTLKVVSLAHTPIEAKATGKVIDVGNGLKADFEKHKSRVKGAIVLVNLGIDPPDTSLRNLHRSEKTALAIEYGASGALFINGNKGGILLTGTCSVTGDLVTTPAVCVTYEDGQMLRTALKAGKVIEATIQMTNKSHKVKARNVIATLPGTDLAAEKIVIGGHLDSWDLSTCAIDNGIGSMTIMDIARTFMVLGLKPRRTIQFVMFMGEEIGLIGSEAWVNKMTVDKSLDAVKLMMNLDMAGNPIGFNPMGRTEMIDLIKTIGAVINQIDTIYKNKVLNSAGLHSDHQPFMLQGVPTINPISNMNPDIYKCYHANCDDFHLVDKQHMHNGVRFTSMMLYALAMVDKIPAPRLSDAETKTWLIQQKLKEELVIGKKWRW